MAISHHIPIFNLSSQNLKCDCCQLSPIGLFNLRQCLLLLLSLNVFKCNWKYYFHVLCLLCTFELMMQSSYKSSVFRSLQVTYFYFMFPSPFLVCPSVSTYLADRVWLSEYNSQFSSSPSTTSPQHLRCNNHQNSRAASYSRLAFRAEKVRVAQVIEVICNDSTRVVWDKTSDDEDNRTELVSTPSLTDTIRFLNQFDAAAASGGVPTVPLPQPSSPSASPVSSATVQNDPLLAIGAHNLFVDAPHRLWYNSDAIEAVDWGEEVEVWDARNQLLPSTPPLVDDRGCPVLLSRLSRPIPIYTTSTAAMNSVGGNTVEPSSIEEGRTAQASDSLTAATSTPSSSTQKELIIAQQRRAQLVAKHRLLILQVGSNAATLEVHFAKRNATQAKINNAKKNDEPLMTAAGRVHLHLARVYDESGFGEGNKKRDSALSFGNTLVSTGAAQLEASEASTIHLQNVLEKDTQQITRHSEAANVIVSRAQSMSSDIIALDVEIERLEGIIEEEQKMRYVPLSDALYSDLSNEESICREGILKHSLIERHVLEEHHDNALILYRSHATSLLAHLDHILLHRLSDFVFGVGPYSRRVDDDEGVGIVTNSDIPPSHLVSPIEYRLPVDDEAFLARIHAREGFSYTPSQLRQPSSSSSMQHASQSFSGAAGGRGMDANTGERVVDVNSVQHLQHVYTSSLKLSFARRLCRAEESSSYARLKKVHELLYLVQIHWKLFRSNDLSNALSNDPHYIVTVCRDTMNYIDEIHSSYYFTEDCPLPGSEAISRLCPPVPPQISENEVDELMTRNMFVVHSVIRWGVSVPFNGRLATLICRFNLHGCVVSYRLPPLRRWPR